MCVHIYIYVCVCVCVRSCVCVCVRACMYSYVCTVSRRKLIFCDLCSFQQPFRNVYPLSSMSQSYKEMFKNCLILLVVTFLFGRWAGTNTTLTVTIKQILGCRHVRPHVVDNFLVDDSFSSTTFCDR